MKLLDQLCIGSSSTKSDMISLLIHHNLALCYQKSNSLPNCADCLKNTLKTYKTFIDKTDSLPAKFKHLKYLSKTHMQLCAILSQQNKHSEALEQAKCGAMYCNEMIFVTSKIIKLICSEKNTNENNELLNDGISFGNKQLGEFDFMQLLGRKVLPILDKLITQLVPRSNKETKNYDPNNFKEIDGRSLFGYLKCSEWVSGLNIGNIMQISPLTIQDLVGNYDIEIEITRETLLEKIALLAVSYFCISTEKRFLAQTGAAKPRESEFWHAKSLQIACSYLPSECPLVNHVLTNYQKHHSPLLQPIVFNILRISPKILRFKQMSK